MKQIKRDNGEFFTIDDLINEAETTIGCWQSERQKEVGSDLIYVECLISDWYGEKFQLTSDEIIEIAEGVKYFFDDTQEIWQ